jgi:hypothetical protein
MSDYLIRDLQRYGVAIRDRGEIRASSQPVTSAGGRASAAPPRWAKEGGPCSSCALGWRWGSPAQPTCGLAKGDEVHTDTAAVVVGRLALALVGV